MRISDWSSDVCSSDLFGNERAGALGVPPVAAATTDGARPWAAQTIAVALRRRTSGGVGALRQWEDRSDLRQLHSRRRARVLIQRGEMRRAHQPPASVYDNCEDRKRVGGGQCVSGRVAIGGCG